MRIVVWKQRLLKYGGSQSLWSPTWSQQCYLPTCSKKAYYIWVSGNQNRGLCEDHAISVYVRFVEQMEDGIVGLPRPLASQFLVLLDNVRRRGLASTYKQVDIEASA